MENSNQSKQVLLSVIGVAILVVAVVGVSFAFFSYTRTGTDNTVETGTIIFNASNTQLELEDAFPVDRATAMSKNDNTAEVVGYATISVQGNTTYDQGLKFDVYATDIKVNTAGVTPRVEVTQAASMPSGVSVTNLHQDAKLVPDASSNALLAKGTITKAAAMQSEQVILSVRVWFDKRDYHISSDPNNNMAASSAADLIADGFLPTGWNGTVVTQDTWNSLQISAQNNNAYSFKIRVRAVEGDSELPRYS